MLLYPCIFSLFFFGLVLTQSFERRKPLITKAVAVLDGDSEVAGQVTFLEQEDDGLLITGSFHGLPRGLHGIHIHQFGNVANGCNGIGPHFSIYDFNHGGLLDDERHNGDLGNIISKFGRGHIKITDDMLSLNGRNSIIGRAIAIHERKDDLGKGNNTESKLNGNSGPILACGVIGISEERMLGRHSTHH